MTGELILNAIEELTLDELMEAMTELERRFVEEFVITPNPAEAYRRAGGSAKTKAGVWSGAYQLLRNNKVARAVKLQREQRRIRIQIEQDWVILQLIETLADARKAEPVYNHVTGEPTGEWKFDGATAAKCIDMLMKHLGMYDRDNRQKAGTQELYEAAMERLRQRGLDVSKAKPLPGGN